MPHEELPFWNVNVPRPLRVPICPDWLANVSDKDRDIIGTWDADYEDMTWDEVRGIISENRIDLFRRRPSDLRRYRHFIHLLNKHHGSVMAFILSRRLGWSDLTPACSVPFTDPTDVKILYNDWPYGVDARIVHLVVWTKFALAETEDGDLTPQAREAVEAYVERAFVERVGRDRVAWFKNWRSLKSVHAVEHFHVMLYEPEEAFVRSVTGGDVPLCKRVGEGEGVLELLR
ncbi:hypothetical protein EJ06DRAFT_579239 [Trichodelitschia bisporula]|uniref:N-acetylglucosamine-induced protein 1 n=1 Tax=Trichodelitschia bisporula TaxID=703511 RepID=A0A6G1I9J3_9PEZI|nr:hypothetical protein EJ06DRAFT_579239 [Trichodelitschia bisporula]